MLARLTKEYEILFNKVKFIQAIISETLKINKVKRSIILQRVVEIGLKPMSEINKVMLKFAKLGMGKTAASKPAEEEEEAKEEEVKENAEQAQLTAKSKDFEYLLGMPMWSLTEEKIDELIR